jgi:uncharacterized membrane-anchored protein
MTTIDTSGRLGARRRPLFAKVPEITASFWLIKLLTTAMGEAASDYLLGAMRYAGLVIGLVGFVVALWLQTRTQRYHAYAYWAAVAMVAVFGTMAADLLHRELGVPFAISTMLWSVAVAITFLWWHHSEGTVDIHSITTRRREMFYWLAVSFTFALGTAAGDLTASQLHLGFVGSIVLFAIVMAVPALGHWRWRLNSVVAFWWAYIVTRPLGASVADWLSKPHKAAALGYGDGLVAVVLLGLTVVTVIRTATRSADREDSHRSPAAVD